MSEKVDRQRKINEVENALLKMQFENVLLKMQEQLALAQEMLRQIIIGGKSTSDTDTNEVIDHAIGEAQGEGNGQ